MEGANTAQSTPIQAPNPPSSAQSLPPQPPPPPSSAPANSRKRPLDNDSLSHNSKHLKIRLLLKDLRPHFLEVLRTPDLQNCKAANEIQEQIKLLVELYSQMIMDTVSVGKKFVTESHPSLPSDNKKGQDPLEKVSAETSDITGTYVVGGSAFGWNFIMFTGKDPVYYGVTKESFRATKVTPPESHQRQPL